MFQLPTNREEAENKNSTFYFTGIKCVNEHIGVRYTSNGMCRECGLIQKQKYKDTVKYLTTAALYSKSYRQANKEHARAKTYGLTPNDIKLMKEKQNGMCLICENPFGENPRNMHVDHCHKTNIARGLLCLKCNLGIGYLKDDIKLLEKAIIYLKSFIPKGCSDHVSINGE